MASIKVLLRKKPNSIGQFPIVIRKTKDRKSSDSYTGKYSYEISCSIVTLANLYLDQLQGLGKKMLLGIAIALTNSCNTTGSDPDPTPMPPEEDTSEVPHEPTESSGEKIMEMTEFSVDIAELQITENNNSLGDFKNSKLPRNGFDNIDGDLNGQIMGRTTYVVIGQAKGSTLPYNIAQKGPNDVDYVTYAFVVDNDDDDIEPNVMLTVEDDIEVENKFFSDWLGRADLSEIKSLKFTFNAIKPGALGLNEKGENIKQVTFSANKALFDDIDAALGNRHTYFRDGK